jgi:hypothetical protein
MGQLVVLYGSLAEGLRVKGPYRNWGETTRAKKAIHDDLGCCVIEGVILTEADTSTGSEFVLVLGNLKEGFVAYGTYATAELAADANSPFRDDSINPHTSDGQRLGCILRLEPA